MVCNQRNKRPANEKSEKFWDLVSDDFDRQAKAEEKAVRRHIYGLLKIPKNTSGRAIAFWITAVRQVMWPLKLQTT